MLRNSGEADRSHGNAAGNKSILEKRRIKEDSNKDDHMKDAHVPKLKKLKKSPSHIYKKSGEIINPHIYKKSAVPDFPHGYGRYASPVAPESFISLPQRCLLPPISTYGDYSSEASYKVVAT